MAGGQALLGIDTGGTFTDFVLLRDGRMRVHKALSTPGAPQEAILTGIAELGLAEEVARGRVHIVHGTTVATNATLEGKGARTAYVANKGMKDLLAIGRQARDRLYDLAVTKSSVELPPELLLEVDVRAAADGAILADLDDGKLAALVDAVRALAPEAVAINLLFSFVNDRHERAIEEALAAGCFVSRSSEVLPEYGEYERGVATWLNARLGPLISDYLLSLGRALAPSRVAIMQSSGLTIAADQAARRAVNLLLSGPVGGLAAARLLARLTGESRMMTFDMGGTSTDVSLLQGDITLTRGSRVAGLPIAIPMADIHTIGAGGGSIAYLDQGGLLQVGPRSAGAAPGPACYGLGGVEPTVTDANLLLGRLDPEAFLNGRMQLDVAAAEAAVKTLAEPLGLTPAAAAQGIVDLASERMAQALRAISIERGHDPRECTLVCFGGSGGLHLCQLAEALEIGRALVPIHCGVLSALGMLAAPPGREITRTRRMPLAAASADLEDQFAAMEAQGRAQLELEGVGEASASRSLDLRYQGQTFTLNLPFTGGEGLEAAFHEAHEAFHGHRLERPVELVNLRAHVEALTEPMSLPDWQGDGRAEAPKTSSAGLAAHPRAGLRAGEPLAGPCLITEEHATTYLAAGWQAQPDRYGNLLLQRT